MLTHNIALLRVYYTSPLPIMQQKIPPSRDQRTDFIKSPAHTANKSAKTGSDFRKSTPCLWITDIKFSENTDKHLF
jgi:hypothetical protein